MLYWYARVKNGKYIHHNPVSYHLNQNEESLLQFDSYRLYAIENLLEIDNFLEGDIVVKSR